MVGEREAFARNFRHFMTLYSYIKIDVFLFLEFRKMSEGMLRLNFVVIYNLLLSYFLSPIGNIGLIGCFTT